MNQKTALAIIIALLVLLGWGVYATFNTQKSDNNSNTGLVIDPNDVPQEVSLQGEFVCLPNRDTTGPQTMECALGIKSDNDLYFAIDAQGEAARNTLMSLQTGLRIQIDGLLVPIEQISSNVWQKYDVAGIISTSNIQRVSK